MESKLAQEFTSKFNPKVKDHALWMKKTNDKLSSGKNVVDLMKDNPMGAHYDDKDFMDVVFVMFSLAMKYSKAVLHREAWVPPQEE